MDIDKKYFGIVVICLLTFIHVGCNGQNDLPGGPSEGEFPLVPDGASFIRGEQDFFREKDFYPPEEFVDVFRNQLPPEDFIQLMQEILESVQ